MLLYFLIIYIGFYVSITTGQDKNLNVCMQSKTVAVQISSGTDDDDLTCHCQANRAKFDLADRGDYTHTPGVGSHKLHVVGQSWNEARKICIEESAHLAVINSKAEEEVLLKKLKTSKGNIHAHRNDKAFLGIHDMFEESEWLTIFGESLQSTGFAQWTNAYLPAHVQPDNAGGNQNCGTLIARGGLDDERCSKKYAFFCELPLSCL